MDYSATLRDSAGSPPQLRKGSTAETPCRDHGREQEGVAGALGPSSEKSPVKMNKVPFTSDADRKLDGARYRLGDMVWAKVKSHPWWPGQIYDPSLASSLARKSKREACVLVAFFGDSTFGWFPESELIPFESNFAQKSKQTTAHSFVDAVEDALDEIRRRVELALSCPCHIFSKMDERRKKRRGLLLDRQICEAKKAFAPAKTLSFVKNLACSPFSSSQTLLWSAIAGTQAYMFRASAFAPHNSQYEECFRVLLRGDDCTQSSLAGLQDLNDLGSTGNLSEDKLGMEGSRVWAFDGPKEKKTKVYRPCLEKSSAKFQKDQLSVEASKGSAGEGVVEMEPKSHKSASEKHTMKSLHSEDSCSKPEVSTKHVSSKAKEKLSKQRQMLISLVHGSGKLKKSGTKKKFEDSLPGLEGKVGMKESKSNHKESKQVAKGHLSSDPALKHKGVIELVEKSAADFGDHQAVLMQQQQAEISQSKVVDSGRFKVKLSQKRKGCEMVESRMAGQQPMSTQKKQNCEVDEDELADSQQSQALSIPKLSLKDNVDSVESGQSELAVATDLAMAISDADIPNSQSSKPKNFDKQPMASKIVAKKTKMMSMDTRPFMNGEWGADEKLKDILSNPDVCSMKKSGGKKRDRKSWEQSEQHSDIDAQKVKDKPTGPPVKHLSSSKPSTLKLAGTSSTNRNVKQATIKEQQQKPRAAASVGPPIESLAEDPSQMLEGTSVAISDGKDEVFEKYIANQGRFVLQEESAQEDIELTFEDPAVTRNLSSEVCMQETSQQQFAIKGTHEKQVDSVERESSKALELSSKQLPALEGSDERQVNRTETESSKGPEEKEGKLSPSAEHSLVSAEDDGMVIKEENPKTSQEPGDNSRCSHQEQPEESAENPVAYPAVSQPLEKLEVPVDKDETDVSEHDKPEAAAERGSDLEGEGDNIRTDPNGAKQALQTKSLKKQTFITKKVSTSSVSLRPAIEPKAPGHGAKEILNRFGQRMSRPIPEEGLSNLGRRSKKPVQETALMMRFPQSFNVPSESQLKAIFARFGQLSLAGTRVYPKRSLAQVVFRHPEDAGAALKYAKKSSVFGDASVSFWLREIPHTKEKDVKLKVNIPAGNDERPAIDKQDVNATCEEGTSLFRGNTCISDTDVIAESKDLPLKSCLKRSDDLVFGSTRNGARVTFQLNTGAENVQIFSSSEVTRDGVNIDLKAGSVTENSSCVSSSPASAPCAHSPFAVPNAPLGSPATDISEQMMSLLLQVNALVGSSGFVL